MPETGQKYFLLGVGGTEPYSSQQCQGSMTDAIHLWGPLLSPLRSPHSRPGIPLFSYSSRSGGGFLSVVTISRL